MKNVKILFYAVLLVWSLTAKGEGGSHNVLSISMRVHSTQKQVILTVKYKNITDQKKYIAPGLPALSAYDAKGNELQYLGAMVKRPPFKISEYIKLKPGDTYSRRTRIDKLYAFLPKQLYTIELSGGYFDPVGQHDYDAPVVSTQFRR